MSIAYRTTEDEPTWYKLKHPRTGKISFPDDLGAHFLGEYRSNADMTGGKSYRLEFEIRLLDDYCIR